MNRRIPTLQCLLAVALAMSVMPAVQAQGPAPQEQRISFSSPDNDDVNSNVPSLAPLASPLTGAADSVRAPSLDFNPSPGGPVPGPEPMPSPEQAAQMQQQLDKEKDWALLTPEEILGVPTAEKLFGLPGTNAEGQWDNGSESLEQRFLQREQQRDNATTNGGFAALSQWNLPTGATNGAIAAAVAIGEGSPGLQGLFFTPLSANPAQNQNAGGSGLFGLGSPPPAPTAPNAEQVAEDEAFQKLITPYQEAPSATPPGETPSSSPSMPDTLLAKSQANPIGASFVPLSGNINAAAGANPMPTLIPLTNTPIAPEWKPQLPPWLDPTPQPGEVPRRPF